MVRVEGLEPPRLAALEPKSSASTNFAIPANYVAAPKSRHIPEISNKARPRMRVENDSFWTNFNGSRIRSLRSAGSRRRRGLLSLWPALSRAKIHSCLINVRCDYFLGKFGDTCGIPPRSHRRGIAGPVKK